jgi:hypothetical protein
MQNLTLNQIISELVVPDGLVEYLFLVIWRSAVRAYYYASFTVVTYRRD